VIFRPSEGTALRADVILYHLGTQFTSMYGGAFVSMELETCTSEKAPSALMVLGEYILTITFCICYGSMAS